MSQQINLYDPSLRRQFEPLTLTNVALLGVVLAVLVGAFGFAGKGKADKLHGELGTLMAQNKALQEQTVALGARVASLKPDPALQVELGSMRSQLAMRGEVIAVLQRSLGPQAVSFAEYLRALSRQAQGNLWLIGFTAAGDGAQMEIRGRMTEGAALPEYIRRLSGERVFQGRAFAALQLQGPMPQQTPPGEVAKVPEKGPRHIEFSLVPKLAVLAGGAGGADGAGAKPLVDQARELSGVRQ